MFKTVLAATALAAFSLSAHAITIVQWDFEGVTAPAGTSTTLSGVAASTGTGTLTSTHATAAAYSTPAGNGSSKSISANTWAVGDYWQFAFSTVSYFGVTVSFDQTGSATGPRDFTLAYSTNGTTFTNFATYTLNAVTWGSGAAVSGSSFSFNLASAPATNNNATVFIRLIDNSTVAINGGAVASAGTDRVDNFTVTSAVPEAGTSAMLAAGLAVLGFMASRRRQV